MSVKENPRSIGCAQRASISLFRRWKGFRGFDKKMSLNAKVSAPCAPGPVHASQCWRLLFDHILALRTKPMVKARPKRGQRRQDQHTLKRSYPQTFGVVGVAPNPIVVNIVAAI